MLVLEIDANEILPGLKGQHAAWKGIGEVLATVPDVISLADVDTSELVQTVDLVVGQEVHVIVSPVDHRWRTPAGLAIVGPSAFGYPVEPVLCGGPSHPTR
ncbi:DUF917 family protein [Mycolicibacterium fortuitum]|uniref:S-methyl thiohydantoin desulfurase domain-containing protein n=1 Tax=Mycolicibacterium fortuitum TaxID=1766 RepID=UPI000D6CF2C7|nr:DUF917 family protein [Mycolicibacterium fortuitum]